MTPFHRAVTGLLLCVLLAACADVPLVATPAPPTPTATPTVPPSPTPIPSPEMAAREFLGAWEKGRYEAMYALVSAAYKTSISQEAFVKRYRDIASEGEFTAIKSEIKNVEYNARQGQISFSVTIDSLAAGQFARQNRMMMTFEPEGWHVNWTPQVIFSELTGGNLVHLFTVDTSRGAVYDRNGKILAAQEPITTVGIVRREIEDEPNLLATLAPILEMDAKVIRDKYSAARPDWYIPIKDLPQERFTKFEETLNTLKGVSLRESDRRAYPLGAIAAHLIGYAGPINPEELSRLESQGYSADDVLGKAGLEKWGESYLRGRAGGTLTIISPSGEIVATLSAQAPEAARNLYTTLDADLQAFIEKELGDKPAAAVVLDARTGEILALASAPGYNLNTLTQGSAAQVRALFTNPQRPLINRATQGLYPTGSIFKVVTASAGLERGGFRADSPFFCNGTWDVLGRQYVKGDWLKGGHGNINLFNGLVQSCNIVFYNVGYELDKKDRSILPTFARAFGFGAPPNAVGVLDEAAGVVPDPTKQTIFIGDMVNVAIGQGDFLATPLQVVNMIAAVGNGGTLYRPRLIAKVSDPKGERRQDFNSEVIGRLPISRDNLLIIQNALKAVTSTAPGTASRAFAGSTISVAGKTGTAEAPPGEAHSWFAAYAPAEKPQIALVVMVEHAGEGSAVAAPIARKIIDRYFAQAPH
ncbi:MAG: penicillin-binding protein 2 [Chloroflexi bacterium]|nr:penicillin-binding protein 2 [Chloroflexota bacterium]